MRTHTSNFKNQIKEHGRQLFDIIQYWNNQGNISSINNQHLIRVNYSVDTTLLKSVMQTLTFESNTKINVDTTKELKYNIYLNNMANSIMRYYYFYIDKIEEKKDTNTWEYTCHDNMIKAMVDYESFYNSTTDTTFTTDKNYYQLDNGKYKRYTGARTGNPQSLGLYQSAFPMTIRDYISAICTKLGITFKNVSDTFTNYNKNVTSEHYVDVDGNGLGYTFRDVLDDLAEATGSFICVDNDGELEIRNFTTTNDTIDEEYFDNKNVNIGKLMSYNTLVLSRGNDSDNIYRPTTLPQNPVEIKISDNPILEQDNREDFIDGIYNNINGLEFYLNDFQTKGILYYEIGDKYNVSIGGTTYPCLMLSDNIIRTQGLKENIHTDEPKLSVTDYKYASNTDRVEKQSRNAYIKANKAEGQVEAIVTGIGDNGVVNGASLLLAINNDTSSATLRAGKIKLEGYTTINNGFAVDNSGNVAIEDGSIVMNDDPENQTHPTIEIKNDNRNHSSTELWSEQLVTTERYNDYTSSNKHEEGIAISQYETAETPVSRLGSTIKLGDFIDQGARQYALNDGVIITHSKYKDGTRPTNYRSSIEIWDETRSNLDNPIVWITEKFAYLPSLFARDGNITTNGEVKGNQGGTFGSLTTYNDATIGGTLGVTGNATIDGDLKVASIVSKPYRISSPNVDHQYPFNRASMRLDQASSEMNNSGYKPAGDGFIQTFFWDTSSGSYDTQLYIPNQPSNNIQIRFRNNASSWANNWKNIPILSSLSQSDFINSVGTGVTIKQFNVGLVGNFISGTIQIQCTNDISTTDVSVFSIKNWLPPSAFISYCGLHSSQWGQSEIGYVYIGRGTWTIHNNTGKTGLKWATISFSYLAS